MNMKTVMKKMGKEDRRREKGEIDEYEQNKEIDENKSKR